jgi:hypothetical protein
MLELAYWIGPTPGVDSNDPLLNRYRDMTPHRGGVTDRYVFFHLHMNRESEMLRTIAGRTYMGIAHITLFHGQESEEERDGSWRVANREAYGVNGRTGLDCPELGGGIESLWYIGSPQNLQGLSASEQRFWNHLNAWAVDLFNTGYTGNAGQSLIFEGGPLLPSGDIDASNIGREVRWNGQGSTMAGGRNPYRLSWTAHPVGPAVDNHWAFNFAPTPPPPPPH